MDTELHERRNLILQISMSVSLHFVYIPLLRKKKRLRRSLSRLCVPSLNF